MKYLTQKLKMLIIKKGGDEEEPTEIDNEQLQENEKSCKSS